MNQSIRVSLLLTILAICGIYYMISNDPDTPARLQFKLAMNEFSKHAEPLELQYIENNAFTVSNTKLSLIIPNNDIPLNMTMDVSEQIVKLTFEDDRSALAIETIILEPVIKNEEIRWKCLNGSVLARYRSKDCKLGRALLSSDFESSTGPETELLQNPVPADPVISN